MGFKKYDGSAWQPITPKKLKGIPYSGTLPATITGTKAGYLHKYKIYGNLEQTGTPTPENPIIPSECGERTENLFNPQDVAIGKYIASDGTEGTSSGTGNLTLNHSAMIAVSPLTTYTFYINKSTENGAMQNAFCWFDENGTIITRDQFDVEFWEEKITKTYQSPSNAAFLIINFRGTTDKFASGMIIEGSTAPTSYIPYGYKLPLTSAGQSVDIYLGESQTTRRIGKFDLSQATWRTTGTPGLLRTTDIPNIKYTSSNLELGNGLAEKYQIHSGSGMSSALNCIAIDVSQVSVNTGDNRIKPTGMFYYALATPETSVVNEPLRKIGNYADTIDSTQTTAQIPTTAGSTTISWGGSGLAPSQFDSIQEWVDIPTYTYTNGAWVADNSN